jgi:hypothetical protein
MKVCSVCKYADAATTRVKARRRRAQDGMTNSRAYTKCTHASTRTLLLTNYSTRPKKHAPRPIEKPDPISALSGSRVSACMPSSSSECGASSSSGGAYVSSSETRYGRSVRCGIHWG